MPGAKGFFVIYFLVFMHRMINQSLQLARRSGSDSSCARENNLFYMMSTWGGLVSNYFLQLLSNSRTEKSREGTRREDKGKGGGGEMPQSQGSRTAVWNRQMRAAPAEPHQPQAIPPPGQEVLLPSQPHSQARGLFLPGTPKSIQFSNENHPSFSTMKRHPCCKSPQTDIDCGGWWRESFEI